MKFTDKALSFILGGVDYAVDEADAKKMLNLIISNSLPCSEPRIYDSQLHFACPLTAIRRLLQIAAKENIKLTVTRYRGLPYIFYKYKNRLGLSVGTSIGLLIILISGFFVWDIRCQDEEVTRNLTESLRQAGVGTGMYVPALDIYDAEIRFLLENNEYSFIAINLRGTVATLELRRRKKAPDKSDENIYSNLIASKTGKIITVEALSGFPVVEKGMVVAEGDLLVSGAFERRNGTTGLVRSSGRIMAECMEEITISVPLVREKAVFSGKTENAREYSFFGKKVLTGINAGKNYDYTDLSYSFRRVDVYGFRIPLDVYTITYYEVDYEVEATSFESASDEANELFKLQCEILCGGEEPVSVESSIVYDEKTNSAVLTGELVYITDIASELTFEAKE